MTDGAGTADAAEHERHGSTSIVTLQVGLIGLAGLGFYVLFRLLFAVLILGAEDAVLLAIGLVLVYPLTLVLSGYLVGIALPRAVLGLEETRMSNPLRGFTFTWSVQVGDADGIADYLDRLRGVETDRPDAAYRAAQDVWSRTKRRMVLGTVLPILALLVGAGMVFSMIDSAGAGLAVPAPLALASILFALAMTPTIVMSSRAVRDWTTWYRDEVVGG